MAAQAETAEEYQYASADYGSLWQACVDESTGYIYYWNSSTNEVSWEPPVDYASLLQPPPPPPPPLPTGPDPALLAEQGIQLITSYGGDSTDSDSDDDEPARPSRPVARARSPSPVTEYGPSLPPPEQENGPADASPIAEFGPQLPPACSEAESEPPSEEGDVAPLSMGPFGTTSAAFVGPLMPPEVALSPALTADNEGEDTADSEEEALLAQLRERAAQLKQLGGELPSGVEATIEAEDGGEASEGAEEEAGRHSRKRRRHSRSKSPGSEVGGPPAKGRHRQPRTLKKSDGAGDCEDAPAVNDDPMLDIISAIENERPPDYEPDEDSTESELVSGARAADEKGDVKLSVKSPPTADGDVPSAGSEPADDILSAIEKEVPPDHQETSLESVTVKQDSRDSPSTKITRVKRTEPAEGDTTLDIFSAIENEIPPDYAEASPKSRTEETPMEIASDSEEKQESSAEQDAKSAGSVSSTKKQKTHVKAKDPVSGSRGGSTALAGSEPMDIISEIENELPPDYAGPTSQPPDNAAPDATRVVAEPDKSSSKPTDQSSLRRKGRPADSEPSEAKSAPAAAVPAKTLDKKQDNESPPKRARRRSRSVQGMGLIASYGSDSDSDSDSQEVSQAFVDRVTDSDRSRVRGETPTPPLPGNGRVAAGSAAVTDGSSAQPPGTADPTASTDDTPATSETPASTGLERASRPERTRPRKKRTLEADSTATSADAVASAASAETADATSACYTTFSAGAYEAPVMAAQDGTRVGFGFHDNGAAERMAWETDSDTARKSSSSDGGSRLKFVQFQKGATLKPAQAEPVAANSSVPERPTRRDSPPSDETQSRYDSHEDEAAIRDLVSEIVDKLEFLGVASETVTPLKVFAVQTQTLLDAWTEGALKPAYFRRWLNGQAAVFAARERESAPPGWTMHWNRKLKRYSYTNQKTRLIMYTFPETADEADIPQPQPKKAHVPAADRPPEASPVAPAPAPAAKKATKDSQAPAASKPAPPPPAPVQPAAPKPENAATAASGGGAGGHAGAPSTTQSGSNKAEQPAPPPPPTLRPTKRRVPPPPVLSAYEPLPPGVDAPPPEEEVSEPVPPPPPPPQISAPEPPPPPPPASELLSELDSFYSEVGMLDEMSKPVEPASPEPAPPALPAAAPAADAAAHTQHRKKKKAKLNSALVHKKKGVDKLVAKWKTVQKELR